MGFCRSAHLARGVTWLAVVVYVALSNASERYQNLQRCHRRALGLDSDKLAPPGALKEEKGGGGRSRLMLRTCGSFRIEGINSAVCPSGSSTTGSRSSTNRPTRICRRTGGLRAR
jgi:hypothetical protein